MTDTYTNLKYHLIWSTKRREPFLNDQLQEEVYEYMAGIIKNVDGHPFLINGTKNHVHVLMGLHPAIALSKAIQSIKSGTSAWIKEEQTNDQSEFQWQAGYGAFTVSHSRLETVYDYIEQQDEHHQNLSFADEFRMFLDRHDIDYDSKYIF